MQDRGTGVPVTVTEGGQRAAPLLAQTRRLVSSVKSKDGWYLTMRLRERGLGGCHRRSLAQRRGGAGAGPPPPFSSPPPPPGGGGGRGRGTLPSNFSPPSLSPRRGGGGGAVCLFS